MVTIAWWRQTVRLASDQQDAQTNSCCQHEKHGISWPWTRCPSSSARQCRNGEPCTKPLAGRGSGQWRGARRRMPVPGSLLVTVADTDQNRLAPRPAQNLKAGRQVSAHETHRNGHRRKARRGEGHVGDEELCAVGVEGYRRAVPVTTKSASQQPH